MGAGATSDLQAWSRPMVGGWYAVPVTNVSNARSRLVPQEGRQQELLPFRIRVAASEEDLKRVACLRKTAYARHLPAELTKELGKIEPMDRDSSVAVLLAESKVDHELFGTLRIQTNRNQPLALQQSYVLPAHMAQEVCAEVTRLAVSSHPESRLIKTMLIKAAYLWCHAHDVRYVLVTARAPLDRQYARLMFQDVDPSQGFVPLAHVFGLPHRVMYCDIQRAIHDSVGHPLYQFWFKTDHPDIDLPPVKFSFDSPKTRSTP